MSELAIRVEDLGKRYRLGQREPYRALRDVLTDALYAPLRRVSALSRRRLANDERGTATDQWIWALRHVSFEVKRGEVVGLIGRNGAGKSTVLKILSRITEPTEGHGEIHGGVGSLLEVGTGFHTELTGRENIYLNGAIMGMKKVEIDRKFDEILTFAEIEGFIDTPVKYYSSGMYMRLAFAVAAHLEREIVLVDEVLAVGDAAFQKKCLGKMNTIAKEGRTVLFVSHNMMAVEDLCDRVIWLHNGKIREEGESSQIVSSYLRTAFSPMTERVWSDVATAPGNDRVRLHWARVRPANGLPSDPITVRTHFVIEFAYWNLTPGAHLNIFLQLYNEQGILVFEAGPIHEPVWRPLPVGLFRDVCHVPADLLNDGMYRVVLHAVNPRMHIHREPDILLFHVRDTSEFRAGWYGKWAGAVRPILDWSRRPIETDKSSATGALVRELK